VKSRLWSGVLCSTLFLLVQAGTADGQQTAPPAAPAPAVPAPTTQTPATPAQTQETPAPPPAKPPVLHDTGGDVISIEPMFWLTRTSPNTVLGAALVSPSVSSGVTPQTTPGNLEYPGGSRYGLSGVVTIPTGKENNLQFSYFQVSGDGDTFAPTNMVIFTNPFAQGDLLVTTFKVENFKLSWNYLNYPFPSAGAKFRFKTLWEFQYLKIQSTIGAPGDPNAVTSIATHSIFFPTIGPGIEYHPYKHLRLELKISGFGIPHHADIVDAEGLAVVTAGRLEVSFGGKGYHFKTSPQANEYFYQTLWGPAVGVRWMWK